MKAFIIIFIIVLAGCKKDEFNWPVLCSNCSISVELNGLPWECKPYSMSLKIPYTDGDSTFSVVFREVDSKKDSFPDRMIFYNIPYESGNHILDAQEEQKHHGISISFNVYEVEYGTPAQTYDVLFDGISFINIEKLDKITGMVELSFQLNMKGEYDDWHFTTYPEFLNFTGDVKGEIMFE